MSTKAPLEHRATLCQQTSWFNLVFCQHASKMLIFQKSDRWKLRDEMHLALPRRLEERKRHMSYYFLHIFLCMIFRQYCRTQLESVEVPSDSMAIFTKCSTGITLVTYLTLPSYIICSVPCFVDRYTEEDTFSLVGPADCESCSCRLSHRRTCECDHHHRASKACTVCQRTGCSCTSHFLVSSLYL